MAHGDEKAKPRVGIWLLFLTTTIVAVGLALAVNSTSFEGFLIGLFIACASIGASVGWAVFRNESAIVLGLIAGGFCGFIIGRWLFAYLV